MPAQIVGNPLLNDLEIRTLTGGGLSQRQLHKGGRLREITGTHEFVFWTTKVPVTGINRHQSPDPQI